MDLRNPGGEPSGGEGRGKGTAISLPLGMGEGARGRKAWGGKPGGGER